MKQFLYRIVPTRPAMLTEGRTENEARVVGEHFAYLKRLTDAGVVLMAGRTANDDASTFGIVVFLAESEDEAAKVMAEDPAVEQGVMRAELFPYRVALWSSRPAAEITGA